PLARAFRHTLCVELGIGELSDLHDLFDGEHPLATPRLGPAGEEPVWHLLQALVVVVGGTELEPGAFAAPAQPRCVSEPVDGVEEGYVPCHQLLRLIKARVGIPDDRQAGRVVDRLKEVTGGDLGKARWLRFASRRDSDTPAASTSTR